MLMKNSFVYSSKSRTGLSIELPSTTTTTTASSSTTSAVVAEKEPEFLNPFSPTSLSSSGEDPVLDEHFKFLEPLQLPPPAPLFQAQPSQKASQKPAHDVAPPSSSSSAHSDRIFSSDFATAPLFSTDDLFSQPNLFDIIDVPSASSPIDLAVNESKSGFSLPAAATSAARPINVTLEEASRDPAVLALERNMKLRQSCDNCVKLKIKCSSANWKASCENCVKKGKSCVYYYERKRGPQFETIRNPKRRKTEFPSSAEVQESL